VVQHLLCKDEVLSSNPRHAKNNNIKINNKTQKNWGCGSSDRVLAQLAQGPTFNPQHHKRKQFSQFLFLVAFLKYRLYILYLFKIFGTRSILDFRFGNIYTDIMKHLEKGTRVETQNLFMFHIQCTCCLKAILYSIFGVPVF
jgi:hypothetical protein